MNQLIYPKCECHSCTQLRYGGGQQQVWQPSHSGSYPAYHAYAGSQSVTASNQALQTQQQTQQQTPEEYK